MKDFKVPEFNVFRISKHKFAFCLRGGHGIFIPKSREKTDKKKQTIEYLKYSNALNPIVVDMVSLYPSTEKKRKKHKYSKALNPIAVIFIEKLEG